MLPPTVCVRVLQQQQTFQEICSTKQFTPTRTNDAAVLPPSVHLQL